MTEVSSNDATDTNVGASTDVESRESTTPSVDSGRLLFLAVIPFAGIFVLTVLAMIAAAFGDPGSPWGDFFDEHGLAIIAWEAFATIAACLVVMTVDRRRTLRQARAEPRPHDSD